MTVNTSTYFEVVIVYLQLLYQNMFWSSNYLKQVIIRVGMTSNYTSEWDQCLLLSISTASRAALQELNILSDVLQIAQQRHYLLPDPVSQPAVSPEPGLQLLLQKNVSFFSL